MYRYSCMIICFAHSNIESMTTVNVYEAIQKNNYNEVKLWSTGARNIITTIAVLCKYNII